MKLEKWLDKLDKKGFGKFRLNKKWFGNKLVNAALIIVIVVLIGTLVAPF